MSLLLEDSFASHPKAIYWSERNVIAPDMVSLTNGKNKYWFKCNICSHEFETTTYSISKMNTWCSYCTNKKLCDKEDCICCFNKSFASSDKAQYFSEKNTVKSRDIFKNTSKRFIFFCNICNCDFIMKPNSIFQGHWCKKCGMKRAGLKQTLKIEDFLDLARKVHCDKYDYSKVIIKNGNSPVIIICKIHGDFNQSPSCHYLDKQGCPKCGIIKRAKSKSIPYEHFLEKAINTHGDRYDYSLSKELYTGINTNNIKIICKTHGIFEQLPIRHLKHHCEKCGREEVGFKNRLSNDEFIIKAEAVHNKLYDYRKVVYEGNNKDVVIICEIHGDFKQNPSNHINGAGCLRCAFTTCLEDFIIESKKVHGDIYDYTESIYNGMDKPIKIICKKCGIFEQKPGKHIQGHGCTICTNKTEKKLYLWLKSIYPSIKREYTCDWCRNPTTSKMFRFDFMIPENKTIIELDGKQHFIQVLNWGKPEDAVKRDVFKMLKAQAEGYKVIRLLQQELYLRDENWLNETLLPEIQNTDRKIKFISSNETIYNEHIKLLESSNNIF